MMMVVVMPVVVLRLGGTQRAEQNRKPENRKQCTLHMASLYNS